MLDFTFIISSSIKFIILIEIKKHKLIVLSIICIYYFSDLKAQLFLYENIKNNRNIDLTYYRNLVVKFYYFI